MAVAVAYSLARFLHRRNISREDQTDGDRLLSIDRFQRNGLIGSVICGAVILALWSFLTMDQPPSALP